MKTCDFGPMAHTILPVRIREDLTVFIQGIPHDLTETEATKIANVVRAMAERRDDEA